jgi:hypothetical protein
MEYSMANADEKPGDVTVLTNSIPLESSSTSEELTEPPYRLYKRRFSGVLGFVSVLVE